MLHALYRLLSVGLFFTSIGVIPKTLFCGGGRFGFVTVHDFIVRVATNAKTIVTTLDKTKLCTLLVAPVISDVLVCVVSFRHCPRRLHVALKLSSVQGVFSCSICRFLFGIVYCFDEGLSGLLVNGRVKVSSLKCCRGSCHLVVLPLRGVARIIAPIVRPVFDSFRSSGVGLTASCRQVVHFLTFVKLPLDILLFFATRRIALVVFNGR